MSRLRERLKASRFLTISFVIHLVLLPLAGSFVIAKRQAAPPDFTAGSYLTPSETLVTPPDLPPEPQQSFTPEMPQIAAPTISALTTSSIRPTFKLPVSMPVVRAPTLNLKAASAAVKQAAATRAPARLPGTMSARTGGSARTSAMQMNGGKKESEEAVLRGLRYLVSTQNANGSWGGGLRSAVSGVTGLSLLCFLGHGETPTSTDFGPAVQKAVEYLIGLGNRGEGRLSGEETFTQTGVYAHAIATYALCEYYMMTKDGAIADLLEKAVTHIVNGQMEDGSWRYSYRGGNPPDTSVTAWQIQALKAAYLSGLNVPGVEAALEKSMGFLQSMQAPVGAFIYQTGDDGHELTGAGVYCTALWRQRNDPSVTRGAQFLLSQIKTKPLSYQGDGANLYAWYYNTQALMLVGGSAWSTWNAAFQDQLVKNQSADGSWPSVKAGKMQGAEWLDGKEVYKMQYRTTLCVLMLEVYYRYLPSTR